MTGGIPMVRIDGVEVRRLRESQGLTQLFVATIVGVTTDTISRWENKRYPTIKRENGLRLAEALQVALEEILEKEHEEELFPVIEASVEPVAEPYVEKSDSATKPSSGKKNIPLLLIAIVLAFFVIWLLYPSSEKQPTITAKRLLPGFAVANQPFPVAITVSSSGTIPQSLILKENMPEGAELVNAVPAYSAFDAVFGEIKWLKKIDNTQVFAYMVKFNQSDKKVAFKGTVAFLKGGGSQIHVRGDVNVTVGNVHWADADGDGRICDEEILVVYDVFSEIEGLGLDVDQVEEIWLGSGYEWNVEKEQFEVLP